MIVVNYFIGAGYNRETDKPILSLAAVINDDLDLYNDIDLIDEAIDNDDEFEPKIDVLYELYLTRATIEADPIPEAAFKIDKIVEKKFDKGSDLGWITPIVRM